jgi:prevent-host-death family protein
MSSSAFDITAQLADLVDAASKQGPQIVTKDGVETAVLVSISEWKRLQPFAGKASVDPLLDPNGPHDIDIPPRGRFRLREPVDFD